MENNCVQDYNILLLHCTHNMVFYTDVTLVKENLLPCLMYTHCLWNVKMVNQANIQFDTMLNSSLFQTTTYISKLARKWPGLYFRVAFLGRQALLFFVTQTMKFKTETQGRGVQFHATQVLVTSFRAKLMDRCHDMLR